MRELYAAAAEADITPPPGLYMTGFAARVLPSAGVHDPLFARALLLSDGVISLLLISCDLIGFAPAFAHALRTRIARQLGSSPTAVMLSCTHTHSAPASMPFRGVMGIVNHAWLASVGDTLVSLAASLPAQLQPAHISAGSCTVPNIGYNRQDPSHPADDTLRVLAIDSRTGRRIATILNYATHAVVLGPRNLQYSADFPGAAARLTAERLGGIALFLQGACGDIDPLVYQQRGWGSGTFDDCLALGSRLAEAAGTLQCAVSPSPSPRLAAYATRLLLPLDPPPPAHGLDQLIASFETELAQALAPPGNRVQELCAQAMLSWAHELSHALAAHRVPTALPCELHTFLIGDIVIVGAPFELYSDIGRALAATAAPRFLLCAAYTNGLYGYCPTSWAKEQGGYGADTSCRWFPTLLTPLAAGADALLVRALTSILST